jgi:hypothetical protein
MIVLSMEERIRMFNNSNSSSIRAIAHTSWGFLKLHPLTIICKLNKLRVSSSTENAHVYIKMQLYLILVNVLTLGHLTKMQLCNGAMKEISSEVLVYDQVNSILMKVFQGINEGIHTTETPCCRLKWPLI